MHTCAHLQVAILCNHQRAVGKAHDSQMEKLQTKLAEFREQVIARNGSAAGPYLCPCSCCHIAAGCSISVMQCPISLQDRPARQV